MNSFRILPNPAFRDAFELRRRVDEIHAFTRELHDQSDRPAIRGAAPETAASVQAPPDPVARRSSPMDSMDAAREKASQSVRTMNGGVGAKALGVPPVAQETPAGDGQDPRRWAAPFPRLPDVGPELAAFVAATSRNQQLILHTLEMVTAGLNQQQSRIATLNREIQEVCTCMRTSRDGR